MINNSTNIKKINNYLWIQIIKCKNYYGIMLMEMQVLTCDRQKNVAGLKQWGIPTLPYNEESQLSPTMRNPNCLPLLITAILV